MNTAFHFINHSKNNFKTRKGVSYIDESLYSLDRSSKESPRDIKEDEDW